MSFPFSRTFVTLGVVLLSVSTPLSQDATDPAPAVEAIVESTAAGQEVALAVVGEIPSFQPVVSTCTPHPDNVCISPTQNYLSTLSAQNFDTAAVDQTLADLVTALVPLAPSGEDCGVVDSEVPAAIRLIASQTSDAAQAAQFNTIANTIADCVNFETAAIGPVASPN